MAYKISGITTENSRIIVIKQSDWTVETVESGTLGAFTVNSLSSGNKIVIARNQLGMIDGFGTVEGVEEFGTARIAITNNDNSDITPQYSFNSTNWNSTVLVSGTSSRNYDIEDLSTGSYTMYFKWTDPDDSTTYSGTPDTKTIYDGQTTIWNFTITEHLGAGDRGVFMSGGRSGTGATNEIDYIAISSNGNAQDFGDMTVNSYHRRATSNGTTGRGVACGGANGFGSNIIEYITISSVGDASDFGDYSLYITAPGVTSNNVNDRGVIGGGYASFERNTVGYITISSLGNSTSFGILTQSRSYPTATSNGTDERGIFCGGVGSSDLVNTVDYITISSAGSAIDFGDISVKRSISASTSNAENDRGVIIGGDTTYVDNTATDLMDFVTITTTGNATSFGTLTQAVYGPAATSNGTNEKGVIGGGEDATTSNIISYITISSAANAIDFGDLFTARYSLGATSDA